MFLKTLKVIFLFGVEDRKPSYLLVCDEDNETCSGHLCGLDGRTQSSQLCVIFHRLLLITGQTLT